MIEFNRISSDGDWKEIPAGTGQAVPESESAVTELGG
jgi:hypothetical protein